MIDIISVVVGVLVGGSTGYVTGTLLKNKYIQEINAERNDLQQKLTRLTDRDARGRFVRNEP